MNRRASLQESPIEMFVPHRGSMCIIDRLVEANDELAVVEAAVRRAGPFVRDGSMPAWFGLEVMAQTVAAWSGYRAWCAGRAPCVGLLLGTRRFESVVDGYASGSLLRIEARKSLAPTDDGDRVGAGRGFGMFDCRVLMGQRVAATARLAVVEPDFARPLHAPHAAQETPR